MAGRNKKSDLSEKTSLWLTDEQHFAFLAIRKTDNPLAPAFATGDENYIRKVIEAWKAGDEAKSEDEEVEEPELPLETTEEATLNAALKKAVAFTASQAHLIAVTSVAPTLFNYVHITSQIFDPIKKNSPVVEEDESAQVYALSRDQYETMDEARVNLSNLRLGAAALPNATLMSLVATFDALIADLIAKMLHLNKDWMKNGDRKIGFDKLSSVSSLEQLIAEAIGDEIYQFTRGSHDEQAKYIETTFGVSVRSRWKRWPDYIEIFERRNLIAHGETKFNARYASICTTAGHKGSSKLVGQTVEVRSAYLRQALDILTEFAVLLPFAVWRKLSDEQEEKAFSQLNEAAYNLIQAGRYTVAERILEFGLSLQKVKVPAIVIQRLIINRASALHHASQKDQAIALLDEVDWSASSEFVQICMHAVRGDADEVARLIPKVAASGDLNGPTFKQWPCFSFVRDDAKVKEAFQSAFGEPLRPTPRQTPPTVDTEPDASLSTDAPTVH